MKYAFFIFGFKNDAYDHDIVLKLNIIETEIQSRKRYAEPYQTFSKNFVT